MLKPCGLDCSSSLYSLSCCSPGVMRRMRASVSATTVHRRRAMTIMWMRVYEPATYGSMADGLGMELVGNGTRGIGCRPGRGTSMSRAIGDIMETAIFGRLDFGVRFATGTFGLAVTITRPAVVGCGGAGYAVGRTILGDAAGGPNGETSAFDNGDGLFQSSGPKVCAAGSRFASD